VQPSAAPELLVPLPVRALVGADGVVLMPLVRYFSYVGGVLLTLMFFLDARLPKLPVAVRADASLPIIRIHSERKWPERVVFDTSLPTIAPMQAAEGVAGVPATVADASAIARLRDTFALLRPSDQKQAQISEVKRPEVRSSQQRNRQFAKRRTSSPLILVAQRPQIGLFGTW
jgi:hypothetical protein